MKKLFKLTFVAAIMLLIFSCEKDYLEREPSEFITVDQIADAASRNPDVIAGTMTGIYALMFETGTGGTTGHDDYGHKGYDVFSDMLSSDMALSVSTYGWYRASITEYQCTQDFTYTDNYQVWRYYYRIIRSANTVIDALGGNDAVPDLDENKYILGQAKTMRAHSYFYLTQYFQKTYNPTEEILPLYDDLLDQNGPKVAASEIYALIESDLVSAITLLNGFTRTAKVQINQNVAKGVLAYVYGAIGGRDAEVKTLTGQIIGSSEFTLMNNSEVLGGFNDANTPGWMWGADITADAGLDLVSWWGQIDYFSYSYAAYGDSKAIDSDLYDAIPATDVRKNQFYYSPGSSLHLMPINKFYDADRVPTGSSVTVKADYIYMRVAEMYLLNAEASVASDAAGARTMLKAVLDQRVDDSSYVDALSGQALSDEIYLQTRIELWGEGKSYLALKRNKETVTRGDNHLSFVGEPISYDDERMTFEIPEAELQNNPFISDQNN